MMNKRRRILQAAYLAICYMNGICDDRRYKYGND